MPHESNEWHRIAVHLRLLDRPKERHALIAADGDPRQTRTEQCVIHQQPSKPTVAILHASRDPGLKWQRFDVGIDPGSARIDTEQCVAPPIGEQPLRAAQLGCHEILQNNMQRHVRIVVTQMGRRGAH